MAKKRKRKDVKDIKFVNASYDTADTYTQNENRWKFATTTTPNQANNLDVRTTLRNRARYEFDNNTYCFGLIDTLAKDTIGTGPRLQMIDSSELAKKLEKDWGNWVRETDYTKKLLLMRTAKARDGESFALKVNKKRLKNPVKLFLQILECDRISSHYNSKTTVDGIWLDKFGDPEAFNLLDINPSDNGGGFIGKGKQIKAEDMLMYAHTTRAGQVRGVPEITSALQLFVQLRSFTLSVLTSAETASNFSAIMHTDATAEESDEFPEDFAEVDLKRNTMMNLPFGWKITQLKPEQPITNFTEFRNAILNEIARCLQIPFNVASGNSSDYNYASGRLDIVNYQKSIDVERFKIDREINDPVFFDYAREWMVVHGVPEGALDLAHTWMYDGREHVDPVKNAKAQETRMLTGITNLAIECAKDGSDWEEVLIQKLEIEKKEKELRESMGLVIEEKETKNEEV